MVKAVNQSDKGVGLDNIPSNLKILERWIYQKNNI